MGVESEGGAGDVSDGAGFEADDTKGTDDAGTRVMFRMSCVAVERANAVVSSKAFRKS